MNQSSNFEEQVKETYRSLKLFLRYLGLSENEIPDLAQEVYIKAYKAYEKSYNREKSFKTWLFAIAKNTLIDWKRRQNAKKNTVDHNMTEKFINGFDSWLDTKLEIKQTLAQLSPRDQLIIELRFFQDLPFKDLAKLLETSEGAIKMRTMRIIQKLRKKME